MVQSISNVVGISLLLYICLVRSLRWRRYHAIHRKYNSCFESGTLTPEEAQQVILTGTLYDMPTLINYSLAFALFKTYGIPSISETLKRTKELASKSSISRRYADTEILITTFVVCPISGFLETLDKNSNSSDDLPPVDDPRAMIALSRVNWLHSQYKITNDDFLYTLSLFVWEPQAWAARHGWRPLSPLECYAWFVFWSEIGRRMGIQDIPGTIEEMRAWSLDYEEKYMVPAQSNSEVAVNTTEELLHVIPEAFGIRQFFRNISVCLLEERVRIAMMQPEQPWYLHALIRSVTSSSSFIHRWLCLPRRHPKSVLDMRKWNWKTSDGQIPRMHPVRWQSKPWYKPESTGIGYLRDKILLMVGYHSEMPGPHLKSGGYRLEEMGPARFENSGHAEVMQMARELQGCPFTAT